jgi:CHAD domain-containing protein
MPYSIKDSDKTLADAVRRIATEQAERALSEASDAAMDQAKAPHEIRKHCKKIRGLIRLVRPGFPTYSEENAAIRDLARELSGVRDVDALIETHDKLMALDEVEAGRFAPVRAALTRRRKATEPIGGSTRDDLRALTARIPHWQINRKPRKLLEGGLRLTLTRAAEARIACRETLAVDTMHEWRKRVKYHWYHVRLLATAWPAVLKARAAEAKRLSELLGDHRDLKLYADFLASAEAPKLSAEAQTDLSCLVARRLADLEREAFALGARFFAEEPGAVAARLARFYRIWEREARL